MDGQLSQGSVSSLIVPPDISEPSTPAPAHASLLQPSKTAAVHTVQTTRVENATSNMTPPPSTQIAPANRAKTRTPTPLTSHISTPPPTIEATSQSTGPNSELEVKMTMDQIASASQEELRARLTEVLPAYHEARTSAAHYKLQYQMLSAESAAAMERIGVEMRMAQCETDVLQTAEQQKVTSATPLHGLPNLQDPNMRPVHVDLYNAMIREIRELKSSNSYLASESQHQQSLVWQQEAEIASLNDKVTLLRDRIRENRDHLSKFSKRSHSIMMDATPRSEYNTPHRGRAPQEQQGFAALLHATEMASQEAVNSRKKPAHTRNMHSLSSLPSTPSRSRAQTIYQTPSDRQPQVKVPATAPQPRTSSMRAADVYQRPLPVSQSQGPPSDDGTVSASDNDSEAETDILDPPSDEVYESQASQRASAMLRSDEQQTNKNIFKREEPLGKSRQAYQGAGGLKQSTLFGAVTKGGLNRDVAEHSSPAKKVRSEGVGLGIGGIRE